MNIRAYRLLRNNKEQGPFTAEELIQKNLKPYDLIWIDGRSAAWSYPGEMSEFKMYAVLPGKENINKQPVSPISPSVQAAMAMNNNITEPAIKQKPRYKVSADWSRIQTIPKPSYINISADEPKKMVSQKMAEQKQTAGLQSKSLSWEAAWLDWKQEKTSSTATAEPIKVAPAPVLQTQTLHKNKAEPVLEIKYEEPLDAIKDRYIQNIILHNKKAKKSFSLGKASEFIVPTIALVIIFSLGYWLLHNTNATASVLKSSPLKSVQPAAVNNTNQASSNLNDNTAANTASLTSNSDKQNILAATEPIINDQAEERKTTHTIKSITKQANYIQTSNKFPATEISLPKSTDEKTIDNSEKQSNKPVITNASKDNINNDPSSANTGDLNASENRPVLRRTNTNDDAASDQSSQKNETAAAKHISTKSSANYVTVPEYIEMSNGSADLKIQNISDVNLDLVVVNVQYYDASNRFHKGETLYLHNLKAGKNVIVKTPKDMNAQYATSKVSLVSSDANNVYVIGDN
ncbi:MAG: hypothetical protein ABI405_06240 [Parafilimonas sp.]